MSKQIQSNDNMLSSKATVFRFTLEKISFMYEGMFLLKLTVNNSFLSDKSGVRLRTKISDKFLKDFSIRTEVIGPSKKETFSNFLMDEYSFYLPKGFCKNDMEHDVYLLIEALQVLPDAKTQIIGTVKLPIYPRSDVNANYNVDRGEPFYTVRASIRLLRPNMNESNLHCGDLFYKSEFSEILEILEAEPAKPTKPAPVIVPPTPVDIPKPPIENAKPPPKKMIEVSSSSMESPKPIDGKPNKGSIISFGMSPPRSPEVPEIFPPPAKSETSKQIYNLLSPADKEEISVFVRAAENIFDCNQCATASYVVCTLKTDETIFDSSHVTSKATSIPFWEDILNLVFTPDKVDRILSIKVIDSSAGELITEFLLPIKTLEPFSQHHLKLSQSFPCGNVNPTLFVTLIRKLDHYPLAGKEHTFAAIIIKPLALFHEMHEVNKHSLSCFAYLSNDRTQKISKNIQSITESFTDVLNPVPSNYSYHTTSRHPMWSGGQLSIPTSIQREYDSLNFPFLFCQKPEIDTAFTANSFIVLDFYSVPTSVGMNWMNNPPVAQSILKLDKLLYRQLQGIEKCLITTYGLVINRKNVPLWIVSENDVPVNKPEKECTVRIKISLTSEKLTDGIYPESDIVYRAKEQPETTELPNLPIIKNVSQSFKREPFLYKIRSLRSPPSGDYVFNEPDESPSKQYAREISPIDKTRQMPKENKEFQYTNRLKKMQIELMNLREQYQSLRTENQSLNDSIHSKNDRIKERQKNNLDDIKSLTLSDLYQKYDKLRRGLGSQLSLLADYQAKEKDLRSLLSFTGSKEANDIYKRLRVANEKLKTLEQKVTEKEAVISRLEIMLYGQETSPDMVHGNSTTQANKPVRGIGGRAAATDGDNNDDDDDDERNHLYDLVERSESRIRKLQNELIELSRKRGARKQMLLIQERQQLFHYNNDI